MDSKAIIAELEAERDRIDQAISALRGSKRGRRGPAAGQGKQARRRLSAAAKRRVSEMKRKRWAPRFRESTESTGPRRKRA